ncbi:MAG: M67 family metallopeptidase [Acidobacteriota bacterium]|nr:M67 family metallopeptidase [Acidobacteriota bacterium]
MATRHHNEIAAHGERDYPHECCGLLLGRFSADGAKFVVETYPISNAREEDAKRNRFLIRPQELMRGERYAETKSWEVIGFYHSHPDHPAVPSQYDLDHAWPIYSYIVISVSGRVARDLRSWEMEPDRSRFSEEGVLNETTAMETSAPVVDERLMKPRY